MGTSGGLYNSAATATASAAASNVANFSFNPSPDIIAKVAFEPGFGQYEVFGVYSRFRDRIFPWGRGVCRSSIGLRSCFRKYVGYGSPLFSNSGCFTETIPSTTTLGFFPGGLSSCTADTRVLVEGTFGIWFKPYDGSKEKVNRGRIQWGPQFSYVDRNTWSGVGGEPHGLDGMIFTSFRYYLP